MASARYTLNIPPEQPEEPKHEMTRKEKIDNFFFYYKWHLVAAAVALVLIGMFVHDLVSQVDADYTIGILSDYSLPAGVADGVQEQLVAFCDDRNGDGRVVVQLAEYTLPHDAAAEDSDPQTRMANVTRLMADTSSGTCMLFLTKYPAEYQAQYGIFAYNDGTAPVEGETPDAARFGVKWADCPALTSLPLGEATYFSGESVGSVQEFLSDYKLLRRVGEGIDADKDEKKQQYYESSMALFDAMTAGAAQ